MKDDPLDIDALHVIVGDLQTCASMIKEAWLEDREDEVGYLADRLQEHLAELNTRMCVATGRWCAERRQPAGLFIIQLVK